MPAMSIRDAAARLGEREGTLRRWIREGCPATRGRRGRGCATQVDPEAVTRWRQAHRGDALLMELADALPDVLADAVSQAHQLSRGIDKRQLAGVLAATWYTAANAVVDHLHSRCPTIPHLDRIPESIERLRKIERG